MLQAILRGKLSREQENMEDMLTSNVFGLLRYVAPEDGLFKFLALSENSTAERPLSFLEHFESGSPRVVSYEFWPWLHEPGCNGCEPDVVLRIDLPGESRLLILVEAKYLSGKSSEADTSAGKPTDQLAREWTNLESISRKRRRDPTLIYLTASTGFPHDEIEASLKDLEKNRPQSKSHLLWLSWRHLNVVCKESKNPILIDLGKLLDRLGLRFFGGFNFSYEPGGIQWEFSRPPLKFNWEIATHGFGSTWRFNA